MQRFVFMALIGYFALCLLGIAALGIVWRSQDLAPDQPLDFSHELHAGRSQIACTHCHHYTSRGPRATLPPMSVCAECHGEMTTDKPDIQRLQVLLKKGEPIPWTQVYDLPWHVVFTHKRHIRAGVDCWTCHGDVQAMTRMRRVRTLQMGWCVGCHRKEDAPTDCWTCHK